MTSLNVEKLSTRYQTSKGEIHALEDASFSLNEGESIGISPMLCVRLNLIFYFQPTHLE